MVPLTGYTDRISAMPGGAIGFKISSTFDEPYAVDVVRIIHGDPNPAGPGLKYEVVETGVEGSYPSRAQPVHLGSYVTVPASPDLALAGDLTVIATIWPTLPKDGRQAVVSRLDEAHGTGFALEIDEQGARAIVGDGRGGTVSVSVGKGMRKEAWYRVWARYDAHAGTLSVGQHPLKANHGIDDDGSASVTVNAAPNLNNDLPLLIAARPASPAVEHFNGKIEQPSVYARALHDPVLPAALRGERMAGLIAQWDFSREMSAERIIDVGGRNLNGKTVNMPTRAMRSSNWSGREMSWKHAPAEYAAIHFHEDDIYDCGWQTDFELTVPEDMKSGIYGARLRCGDAEEIIPFYVRRPAGKPTSDIVYLASNFTHQIYANHARNCMDESFRKRMADWGARPWNPDDHKDYGISTYNYHTDGSGICYSSRLRPILTMRPNYLTLDDPRGSGLRHFSADTHITDWLEATGHDFDVICDEDLDDEGAALLEGYKVVITSTHPEYHTLGTLDALQHHVDHGGRLIYLGGNGFYWRVARNPEVPGMLEIRRGEGGIRAWAAEPGEYYNALDGAYGGLWRRSGRAPQQLAGVGFSAQGIFDGSYYRRQPGADDPRAAWIMEGVDDEIIGDFGLSGGGAAGFELDRVDHHLGSPENIVVVASSEAHADHFIPVHEERLTHVSNLARNLIRADMSYFEVPGGGAVFSTGSITFGGSFSHNNYDNNVSRIIRNVLARFRSNQAG